MAVVLVVVAAVCGDVGVDDGRKDDVVEAEAGWMTTG